MDILVDQCISARAGAGVNFLASQYSKITNMNHPVRYHADRNEYVTQTYFNGLDSKGHVVADPHMPLLKSHSDNTIFNRTYNVTYKNFFFVDSTAENGYTQCLMELKHLLPVCTSDYFNMAKMLRQFAGKTREELGGVRKLGDIKLWKHVKISKHSSLEYVAYLNNPHDPLKGLHDHMDSFYNKTFDCSKYIDNIKSFAPNLIVANYHDMFFKLEFPDHEIWGQLDKQAFKEYSQSNINLLRRYKRVFSDQVADELSILLYEYQLDLNNT